jgi:hypothetical protein
LVCSNTCGCRAARADESPATVENSRNQLNSVHTAYPSGYSDSRETCFVVPICTPESVAVKPKIGSNIPLGEQSNFETEDLLITHVSRSCSETIT